jgi:hypothetical protein
MTQFRHPKTGGLLPSFARKYLLTTVPASNALGHWFTLKFTDLAKCVFHARARLGKSAAARSPTSISRPRPATVLV